MSETNHPMSGAEGEPSPKPGRELSELTRAREERATEQDLSIAVTTLDGFFTYVSTGWARLHCYTPEEMLGKHVSMCHTGAQMTNLVAPLEERAMRSGQDAAHIRHIDKYGTTFATYLTIALQPGHGRQLPRLIRIAQPVSAHTSREARVPSEHWLEETGALIVDLDLWERVRYANQRWLAAMGYSLADLSGLRLEDITRPQHIAQWRFLLKRLAHDEDTANVITVFVTRSGREMVAEGSLSAHVDDTGLVTIRAVMHDITHRREVEREVRAQRALAEALRDIAVVLNSTLELDEVLERIVSNVGRVVEHDAAAVMLIEDGVAGVRQARGSLAQGLAGQSFSLQEAASLRYMVEAGHAAVMCQGGDMTEGGWPAAVQAAASCVGAPIRLKDQALGFLVLLGRNPGAYTTSHADRLQLFADHAATALHNALLYEEIQRMVSTLHERNADLKDFSHTVAHDLKAPLQVLIGYANLLSTDAQTELPDDVMEGLKYIEAYAYKMQSMIDNLLLFSELGSAEVTPEPVDMQVVISLVLARFYDRIQARGVKVDVAPELPPAMGYSPWVEEVFANLIDNSIKYIGEDNPNPRIRVSGRLIDGQAHYEVADNGIGIRPEDQQNLFKTFTRFHHTRASGTGLGLSIARRIVQKLQGSIGVRSELGKGTVFWVKLPAAE